MTRGKGEGSLFKDGRGYWTVRVEMYGLIGPDDEYLHGSRSLEWVKARQFEYPASTITIKRDGVWRDYVEKNEATRG